MTRYRCLSCGGNQYSSNPNRAHEACIYCGNKGTELMKNLEPESDDDAIKRITKEQASEIIETRTQTGRFYTKESDLYIGIDNSTGDAWTEEFKTKKSCLKWLNGERTRDAHGEWLNS
jgi:DNA-directed RNA polymerase subunit RPC12/RpoP